jgi:hypothetical protein
MVDSSGGLYFQGDSSGVDKVVCGSTSQYIKMHYYNNGVFDNVDLFFFNQNEAMAYASTLTQTIPKCPGVY